MTDLTEQWKEGELDIGEVYYVKTERGVYKANGEYLNSASCIYGFDISYIIAPVPTYSEYLALQSDSLAKNEGAEIVAELKKIVKDLKAEKSVLLTENRILNEQLKEVCEKHLSLKLTEGACDDANKILHGHIRHLKKLLKECREKLNSCCPVLYSNLINQIDEVIK